VAWGYNNDIGICDVPGPNADFVAVAGGGYHSLGLKAHGSIVAWGYNLFGQCNVPAPNADFVGVAAGWYHSLGLKADGSIVAWGRGGAPAPNADFVGVAANYCHSLGQKADGSIVTWGMGGAGNPPGPNADFVGVAAGWYHSLGLKCLRGPIVVTTLDDLSGFPRDRRPISLRQAINKANTGSCVNEIRFAAPLASGTIALHSPLPPITASGISILGDIDQDGTPDITITGANLTSGHGLVLEGDGCLVEGLVMGAFPDDGIRLLGASNNEIVGNWILANRGDGIAIMQGSSGNKIGPDNVIGNNRWTGVTIRDPGSNANVVTNCKIGVGADGMLDVGNGQYGLSLRNGAQENTIGADNMIGANKSDGIYLSDQDTSFNTIWGNLVGLDLERALGVGNDGNGIIVTSGASNNYIGVAGPGFNALLDGNVVCGNAGYGILVDYDTRETFIRGNRIWDNGDTAIEISAFARAPRFMPWFTDIEAGVVEGRCYAQDYSIIDIYSECPTAKDARVYDGATQLHARAFTYEGPFGRDLKATVTTSEGTSELNMLPPKLAYIYRNTDGLDIIDGFWDHTALAFLFPPYGRNVPNVVAESMVDIGVRTITWDDFVNSAAQPASRNFVAVDMPDTMVNAAFDWVFHNPLYPDELQIPGHAGFCYTGCVGDGCEKGLERYTCVGLTERAAEESPLGDIVPAWAECSWEFFMLPTTQLAYLRPGLEWDEGRRSGLLELSLYRISGSNLPPLGQDLSVFPEARMLIGIIGRNTSGSPLDVVAVRDTVPGTLGGVLQYSNEYVPAAYDDVQTRWVFAGARAIAIDEAFSVDIFLEDEVWESQFGVEFLAGESIVDSSQGSLRYTRIGNPLGGDLDVDTDVDLADFSVFITCISGQDVRFAPTGCAFTDFLNGDLDDDGDVDLHDFAAFRSHISGP
jgi:hypothetical protein